MFIICIIVSHIHQVQCPSTKPALWLPECNKCDLIWTTNSIRFSKYYAGWKCLHVKLELHSVECIPLPRLLIPQKNIKRTLGENTICHRVWFDHVLYNVEPLPNPYHNSTLTLSLTTNVTRSRLPQKSLYSLAHVPPFHRILWRSVEKFLHDPANKQANANENNLRSIGNLKC